jgi:hypothetical protein
MSVWTGVPPPEDPDLDIRQEFGETVVLVSDLVGQLTSVTHDQNRRDMDYKGLLWYHSFARFATTSTAVYLEVLGECDVLALLVFDSGTAVIGVGKGVLSSVQTADRVNCIPQRLMMLQVGWRSDLQSWSLCLLFAIALFAATSQTRSRS